MTTVYIFQCIGATATALSVAVALWVVLVRDPARERVRLQERDEERAVAKAAELDIVRADAAAIQLSAVRIAPTLTGPAQMWLCGLTNRSQMVISDVDVTVSAADNDDPTRTVAYKAVDLKGQNKLGEFIHTAGGFVAGPQAEAIQAQLAATLIENFSATVGPTASSVMTYTLEPHPAGNSAVEFTVHATWRDVRGNRWGRTNKTFPVLIDS